MAKLSKNIPNSNANYNLLQEFGDSSGAAYRSAANLVLWMQMTPISPTDSSGNTNTTTAYTGSPSTQDFILGPRYVFQSATFTVAGSSNASATNTDGDLCFSSLADGGTPTASSDRPFSISMWVKMDEAFSQSTTKSLCSKHLGGTSPDASTYPYVEYSISIQGSNLISIRLWKNTGVYGSLSIAYYTVQLPGDMTLWSHLAFTYDGSGGADAQNGMKIYLNGQEVPKQSSGDIGSYTGMGAGYNFPLYVGSYINASNEPDAEVAEFAAWNSVLLAAEISAIYTVSSQNPGLQSGIISNPPRIRLNSQDCATGSYPTVSRIGDTSRTGRYSTQFDDRNTIVFASGPNIDGSFPTGLQSPLGSVGNTYISQSVATPNMNATIVAGSTIRKGVADANIHLTPGEDFTPFLEDSLHASSPSALKAAFYLTGSAVSDVGLGFSQPLDAKTRIIIDLEPIATTKFGYMWDTDYGALNYPLRMTERNTTMAYFNFDRKVWETVGMGSISCGSTTIATPDAPPGFSSNAKLQMSQSMVGFNCSTNMQLTASSLQNYGVPVDTFAFPYGGRYHATSSQALSMASYIDRPFLVEKFVYEYSSSVGINGNFNGIQNRDQYRLSLDPGSPTSGEMNDSYGMIDTFFIINQRSPTKVSAISNANLDHTAFGWYDQVKSVTDLPDYVFLTSGSGPTGVGTATSGYSGKTYVDTSRDLVTWGNHLTYYLDPTQLGNMGWTEQQLLAMGLGREVNASATTAPGSSATISHMAIPWNHGKFVMSGTVRPPRKTENIGAIRINTRRADGSSYGNKMLFLKNSSGGRTGLPIRQSGRDLVGGVPGLGPPSGSYSFYDPTDTSGDYISKGYLQEIQTKASPYIILPSDDLVFGWNVRTTDNQIAYPSSDDSDWMTLAPGAGRLILYGSEIAENTEHHPGLNQHLTSDAVHEYVGFHGPPLDQFDTEPRQQFSGTMASQNVGQQGVVSVASYTITTTMSDRQVLGDGASMQWIFGQPNRDACLGDTLDSNKYPKLRPNSQFRNVIAYDDQVFYDCYVPSVVNMQIRLGRTPYVGNDYEGNETGADQYQLLLNLDSTIYGTESDNDWWSRFPFETQFSGLQRQLYDPLPPWNVPGYGVRYFQNLGWYSEERNDMSRVDTVLPQNLAVNGTQMPDDTGAQRAKFIPSVQAKRSLLSILFGTGNGWMGKVPSFKAGSNDGPFSERVDSNGAIRGFKYGIYNTLEESPLTYFRRDSFGQLRDMMEQRPDSRFLATRFGRRYTSGGPVRCRFVSSEGRLIDPSRTASSNLDMFASSSLPYFDDTARNRGPLDEPTLALSPVSI